MRYNLKPKILIKNIDIKHLSKNIFQKGLNIIETYPGVRVNVLIKKIKDLGYDGKIVLSSDFSKLNKKNFREFIFEDLTNDRVFGKFTNKNYSDVFNKEQIKKFLKSNQNKNLIVIGICSYLFKTSNSKIFYVDIPRWELQLRYRNNEGVFFKGDVEADKLKNFKRGYFIEWRMADRIKMKLWKEIDYFIDGTNEETPNLINKKTLSSIMKNASQRPFRLVPYFDAGIWGGQWMAKKFNLGKNEHSRWAWGFDGVPEENSIIFINEKNEEIQMPAINLVLFEPKNLLGEKVLSRFGREFPIRFDFLDTIGGQNLSLQVHPTNNYIKKEFGAKYTQEESYYILDVDNKSDPSCYLGLKNGVSKKELSNALRIAKSEQKFNVEKYINKFPVKKHDHISHPAGCIHASSAGCMVLEISTTPYIFTFKLWDWGRLDFDKKPRPINIEHGENVIDETFNTTRCKEECISNGDIILNEKGLKEEKTGLHPKQFIETRRFTIDDSNSHIVYTKNSVNMFNLVGGSKAIIDSPDGSFDPITVNFAETFIVPEVCKKIRVKSKTKNKIILLQAYVR